jgi:hypothetical protein
MEETRFQRTGYATAITDPEVLSAIASTAYGSIAVIYVEWAASDTHAVVVPWTVIDSAASATAFAEALLPPPRRAFGRNAIGSALLFGKHLIETNEIEGWRRVIDFSGDSANNWNGPPIAAAREEVLAAGITINGLAVLCRFCSGRPSGSNLEAEYEQRIIGGRGAFVVTAENPASFAENCSRTTRWACITASPRRASRPTDLGKRLRCFQGGPMKSGPPFFMASSAAR